MQITYASMVRINKKKVKEKRKKKKLFEKFLNISKNLYLQPFFYTTDQESFLHFAVGLFVFTLY